MLRRATTRAHGWQVKCIVQLRLGSYRWTLCAHKIFNHAVAFQPSASEILLCSDIMSSTSAAGFLLRVNKNANVAIAYLLGLLAMIKCSICSYQCDSWYVSNWGLACHNYFSGGRVCYELALALLSVALAWHFARCSTPFGWTSNPTLPTELEEWDKEGKIDRQLRAYPLGMKKIW